MRIIVLQLAGWDLVLANLLELSLAATNRKYRDPRIRQIAKILGEQVDNG